MHRTDSVIHNNIRTIVLLYNKLLHYYVKGRNYYDFSFMWAQHCNCYFKFPTLQKVNFTVSEGILNFPRGIYNKIKSWCNKGTISSKYIIPVTTFTEHFHFKICTKICVFVLLYETPKENWTILIPRLWVVSHFTYYVLMHVCGKGNYVHVWLTCSF